MDPLILRHLSASGRVTALALHDSVVVNNSTTITIPATAQAGDVAVLVDSKSLSFGSVAPDYVLPSGWTLIDNQASTDTLIRSVLSYRVLQAADAGASVSGMTSTGVGAARKVMLVFRADTQATTVTIGSVNTEATAGDPASQTVTVSSVTPPLVVIAAYRVNGASLSSLTFSPTQDAEVASGTGLSVRYKIFTSAASNVTVDMPDLNAQVLQSFYLQVS